MTAPVSAARWRDAQQAERAWWLDPAHHEQRIADRIEDAAWYAGLLNLPPQESVTVLDIGGGPLPLAVAMAPLWGPSDVTVLDPCDYGVRDPKHVTRLLMPAEDALETVRDRFDECWGYNVLQHVRDPEAVLATAKAAAPVVRWLDWLDTPIHTVHPHSISAAWLRAQFAGWRITFDTEGRIRRPAWSHRFLALVAERP